MLRKVASTRIPTKWGTFETLGFEREFFNGTGHVETALAFVLGDLRKTLLRWLEFIRSASPARCWAHYVVIAAISWTWRCEQLLMREEEL